MFGPLISVLAVILGLVLVGPISPASSTPGNGNNDECVPSDARPASFSDWANSGNYTDWQSSDTAPDPDGQSGDDNPLNLKQAGAIDQQSVPNDDGYTLYYTGSGDGSQNSGDAAWISDATLAGWTQFDERTVDDGTVVDSPAIEGQHYSLRGGSGLDVGEVPPIPNDTNVGPKGIWTANTEQEPHLNGNGAPATWYPVDPATSGLHYTSNESNGKRDWFYYQAPVPAQTHEATHEEFKYSKNIAGTEHTEYRWAIQTRTYTPAKDAVTCDNNPGGNNGSIKVDDDGLPGCNVGHSQGSDVCDNGVGNDPHLGCTFYVEWYNYEANATSTVTFDVQQPTGGTVTAVKGTVAPGTVQLDGDDASGANEAGFDGSELYQLSFTDAPQPNQGWHVKVTTHTTWANGSEDKSKTFWVEGDCNPTPEQPNPVTVTEPVEGCDLSAYGLEPGTGHRDGQREYVLVDGVWQLEDMADVAWGSWVQDTTLTDEEYQAQCAEVQPAALTRSEPRSESSCELGGVHTWNDVYTTPFVWDAGTKSWVPGTETGPVAENDVLTPYTTQQLEDLGCVEVEGEQTHGHHGGGKHHPEVKGEQAHAPAAAVVPTQVEAGLAGTPAGVPTGGGSSNNLPLWALSLGAGMFLIGAGRLRRTSRTTR